MSSRPSGSAWPVRPSRAGFALAVALVASGAPAQEAPPSGDAKAPPELTRDSYETWKKRIVAAGDTREDPRGRLRQNRPPQAG